MADKPLDPAKPAKEAVRTATEAVSSSAGTIGTGAEKAINTMQTTADKATSAAQDIGRSMVERGMANMAEFSKMFGDFKFPASTGVEQFMAAQKRNIEVFSAANRIALEGAQAVAKRHMEIMQQTMAEMAQSMRDLTSTESPQARAARQADMLKAAYERAVAHMKEMADLIQKANTEALGLLNQRFSEALEEVKQLAAQAGTPR